MKKIILFTGFLFFFISCKEDKVETNYGKVEEGDYSIQLLNIDENINSVFLKLKSTIDDSVYFDDSGPAKKIRIGFYKNTFHAGQRAFSFYSDELIKDFEIIELSSNEKVDDNFSNIYFVGMENQRKSLFTYNLYTEKINLLWNKWGNDIVRLERSANNKILNFNTALSIGSRAGFPFVIDAKLYSFTKGKVKRIKKYGDGLQIYSQWENDSVFTNYYTYLDSLNSSHIFRAKNTFNNNFELVADTLEEYDLLNDGFPIPIVDKVELTSPGMKYKIESFAQGSIINYAITDQINNQSIPIVRDSLKIIKVEWLKDYCVLSFEGTTGLLFVVNLKDGKIQIQFDQGESTDFIVHGNLVIFDQWINDKKIIIYNPFKDIFIDSIKVKDGCGINRI